MLEILKRIVGGPPKHIKADMVPKQIYALAMSTTAKCRFNAAYRVSHLRTVANFTVIYLTLGLILVPLLQNADIPLAFPSRVINMISLFLAISTLVVTVVVSSAKYELRAENLRECGDRIKELSRNLEDTLQANDGSATSEIASIEKSYGNLLRTTENHSKNDWMLTIIEMPYDYKLEGIYRIYWYCSTYFFRYIFMAFPLVLVVIETVLITDILGVTTVFNDALSGAIATQ